MKIKEKALKSDFFENFERAKAGVVAPCRFELQSQDPESRMIDHYTMGLSNLPITKYF